jgi:hypothetical protein
MLLGLQSRMELIVACFSYFIIFNVVKVKVILVLLAYSMLALLIQSKFVTSLAH